MITNPWRRFRSILSVMALVWFGGVTPGYAQPVATSPATLPAGAPSISQQAATRPTLDQLAAQAPRATVTGQVVDKAGKPVEGADVILYYMKGHEDPRNRQAAKTTSGPGGAFAFPNALVWEPDLEQSRYNEQEYAIIARHPAHGLEFAVLLKDDKPTGVLITMEAPKSQKIQVFDEAGQPVVGARVYLTSGSHSASGAKETTGRHRYLSVVSDLGLASGLTDAAGTVELPALPSDTSYRVIKAGYAHGYVDAKTTLTKSAHLQGRVTYADGQPVAGAIILYEYQGERLMDDDMTVADADGRYEFKDAAASGYRFGDIPAESQKNAKGTGTLRALDAHVGSPALGRKISFPVNPGDTLAKDLVLEQGCRISGQVVSVTRGQPLQDICLERYIQVPGTPYLDSATVKTDAQGRFEVLVAPGSVVSMQWQGSPNGKYIIDEEWQRGGNYENYQPFKSQAVNKDISGLVLKLKLWEVGLMQGQVLDDRGQPVAGALIYMHTEVPAVKTDEKGNFTLATAPLDRDFDLCAVTKDQSRAVLAHFKAGTKEATLTLAPTATCAGQVKSPDGAPAPNLKFYMDLKLNGQSNYRLRQEPTTDRDGRFTAKNLIPGAQYGVFWSADNEENRDYDYGNAEVNLASLKPGDPITFEAKRYVNTLLGTVVNDKDEPIAGAGIALANGELQPQDQRINNPKPVLTDRKGEFAISRLAAGNVTLSISASGYKTRSVKTATDNVDLKAVLSPLGANCAATVMVVDEAGKPLNDVTITLGQRKYDQGHLTISLKTAQTDPTGKASITVPTVKGSTEYVLYCDVPGRDLAITRVAQNQDVELRLEVPASGTEKAAGQQRWRGIVQDEHGQPLAGAKICVSGINMDAKDWQSYVRLGRETKEDDLPINLSTTSDATGHFTVPRINSRWWVNATVAAVNYAIEEIYFDPSRDDAAKDKPVPLVRGGTVQGRLAVKGSTTVPQTTGEVNLYFMGIEPQRRGASAKVKADGAFESETLAPGKYQVRVTFKQEKDQKFVQQELPTVEVSAGKTAALTVEVSEGIPWRGKVTGARGDGAMWISAMLKGTPGEAWCGASAAVAKDGTWLLYLPKAGEYELQYRLESMPNMRTVKTVTIKNDTAPEDVVIPLGP